MLTDVYWFAAYTYEGRIDQLTLTPHPTQGAYFADDSDPAVMDPIAFLGSFGFNQDGQISCPAPIPATGGCCLLDGSCVVVTASECMAAHGTYYGDDVPCASLPCDPRGACCIGHELGNVVEDAICRLCHVLILGLCVAEPRISMG